MFERQVKGLAELENKHCGENLTQKCDIIEEVEELVGL